MELEGLLSKSTPEKLCDEGVLEEFQVTSMKYAGKIVLRFDSMKNAISFEAGFMKYLANKYTEKELAEYPMKIQNFGDESWQLIASTRKEELENYLSS